MYYVGIDVEKEKHYICILDESKKLACKPFWIYSDVTGLKELIQIFKSISITCDDFIVGVESTGAFSENLYEYITDTQYKVILLNSYQTAKYKDFSTMKKIKNDAIDALAIAELIASDKYKESYISNDDYQELKVLGRLKKSLSDEIKTINREIYIVMATGNPEITKVFPNIFTKTALAIVKVYPTAVDIQKATPKKLAKIFRHIKGNNFNDEKAKFLIELSKSSIYGSRALESRTLMIRDNIRILELICQERDEIELAINSLISNKTETVDSSIENIKTIPSVSYKTIASILSECGDIKRFPSVKSFIGYLGLYPTQYQSGNSMRVGRLAKRGIPIAKHALYMAAVASVINNEELRKIFRDKVSAGKSKKEALIIVSKKLAAIIYSVFKYNKPYQSKRVFIPYKR